MSPIRLESSHRRRPIPLLQGTGMPQGITEKLCKQGIVTVPQLADLLAFRPQAVEHLLGIKAAELRRLVDQHGAALSDYKRTAIQLRPTIPAAGAVMARPPMQAGLAMASKSLDDHVASITGLPSQAHLIDHMQQVSNQGPYPYCTSFATDSVLEYCWQGSYSDTYLYPASRQEPGFPSWAGDGSWIYFNLTHAFRTGHVRAKDFSFSDCVDGRCIEPLADLAAQSRARGFACILDGLKNFANLPKTLKALVTGKLSPKIGPVPVPVSLLLYESFSSYAASRHGLVPMPLPGEKKLGGHAMVVVGYVDANGPENPFGIGYFIVRNSWGTSWAAENPFGHVGHALIPETYFQSRDLVHEAFLCIA